MSGLGVKPEQVDARNAACLFDATTPYFPRLKMQVLGVMQTCINHYVIDLVYNPSLSMLCSSCFSFHFTL